MTDNPPMGDPLDLALMCSARKARIFFYMSTEHTLREICDPGYFQNCKDNILPGNFIFINDKEGKAAVRVVAFEERLNKLYLDKPN